MGNERFPIGQVVFPSTFTAEDRTKWLHTLENFPNVLKETVQDLSEEQLRTPYRTDGWTVAQVVHHLADSHMNAYTRFKLALTEDQPAIKPYDEAKWATLPDATDIDISVSLQLLESLHKRWTRLISELSEEQFSLSFIHPESPGAATTLNEALCTYDHHSRHHLAHITSLIEKKQWK